jgi:hypothetical protein
LEGSFFPFLTLSKVMYDFPPLPLMCELIEVLYKGYSINSLNNQVK